MITFDIKDTDYEEYLRAELKELHRIKEQEDSIKREKLAQQILKEWD